MALSREMEFHADEIAANVAGYLPLKQSLLRIDLADNAYNTVLKYYDGKIPENIKSKNIFKEQLFVMNYLATQSNLSFKNNLPIVSETELNKYNKTKLVIKNQWASHPSTEERIRALELTNIHKIGIDMPAILLFENEERIQEKLSEKLFSEVSYTESAISLDFETFKSDYLQTYNTNSFPVEYNSYYDNKNPIEFDINGITDFNISETMETLFSRERIEMIYDFIALENDKHVLTNISNKQYDLKSFDYDGQKYKSTEAQNLIPKIEIDQNIIKEKLKQNDLNIYKFFYHKANNKGTAHILQKKYINFFKQDSEYDHKIELYNNISEATGFISVATPNEQIIQKLKNLQSLELELKTQIRLLLDDEILKNDIIQEMKENFENYSSKEWEYFNGETYNDNNLQIFFAAANDYNYLLSRKYFLTKLDLLQFQILQLE
jgi:hypothetical protein